MRQLKTRRFAKESMSTHFFELPEELPRPVDDGAADHLPGADFPRLALPATSGENVDVAANPGRVVIYLYPMTGRPGVALPDGWDDIPGARGCTPQSCGFRDHYVALQALNTSVFGLSTQSSDYQREARDRLHLPFDMLSDDGLRIKQALGLPTFSVDGNELYKRLTMVIENGRICKVFYPVFPPDQNAGEVLAWIQQHGRAGEPGPARC